MSRSTYRGEPRRLIANDTTSVLPDGAIMSREQAEEVIQKVLKLSKADGVQVNIGSAYQSDLRFAANQMSTSGGVMSGGLAIRE